MESDKMIKKGIWRNSDMKNRKVEIHCLDNGEQKLFSVWYESDQEPFSVIGGRFESLYDAEHSVEIIIGQKIEWQTAT